MAQIVFLNGEWKNIQDAKVSILDQGILRGDGLFETLRAKEGKIPLIKGHLERLFNSAKIVGLEIPFPKERIEHVLNEILKKNSLKEARIRMVLTRGIGKTVDPLEEQTKPTFFIIAEPYQPKPPLDLYEKGVEIISVPINLYNALFPISVKSISYFHNMAAKRYAKSKGAFDAIFTDANGYCSEGTTSNLFWVKEKEIYTPPLHVGALPGVTRKTIIETLKAMGKSLGEEKIQIKELYQMDEVFLTSSMIQILPVSVIDGKRIRDGIGPITKGLQNNFDQHLRKISKDLQ